MAEKSKISGLQKLRDERGASMVEYILLVALISMMGVASLGNLGQVISDRVSDTSDQIVCAGSGGDNECAPPVDSD